jgi:hypothetical protein
LLEIICSVTPGRLVADEIAKGGELFHWDSVQTAKGHDLVNVSLERATSKLKGQFLKATLVTGLQLGGKINGDRTNCELYSFTTPDGS